MKRVLLIVVVLAASAIARADKNTTKAATDRTPARTSFQSADPYDARWDIRSDVAMAYRVDDTLSSRIAEWKRCGYIPEVMTGVAWGEYEAYIRGDFDGR